jgi:hypothetical protein
MLKDINSVCWYRYGFRNRFSSQILGSILKLNIDFENNDEQTIYHEIRRRIAELNIINREELIESLLMLNISQTEISAFFAIINK